MSNAARKARKRAGIKFVHTTKKPTVSYRTKKEKQKARRSLAMYLPPWMRGFGL